MASYNSSGCSPLRPRLYSLKHLLAGSIARVLGTSLFFFLQLTRVLSSFPGSEVFPFSRFLLFEISRHLTSLIGVPALPAPSRRSRASCFAGA